MSNSTQAVSLAEKEGTSRFIKGIFALAPLPQVIKHASSSRDKTSPVDFREAAHQAGGARFCSVSAKKTVSKLSLFVSMTLLARWAAGNNTKERKRHQPCSWSQAERSFPRPPPSSGYTPLPIKQGFTLIKGMKTP